MSACDVVYVRVESEEPRSSDGSEEPRSSGNEGEEPRSSASDGETTLLVAPSGATLRDVLREGGCSPHTRVTERANCGGRGLCATCGVRIDGGPPPGHWHDVLAARWGYPRLSCQVTLDRDLRVRLPEKVIWGGRREE